MSENQSSVGRWVRGFGRFWWDFLVGDTPEITVAVIVLVGAVALLTNIAHVKVLAYVALPLLVIITLVLSLRAARKTG
jgi:hypothetical protein